MLNNIKKTLKFMIIKSVRIMTMSLCVMLFLVFFSTITDPSSAGTFSERKYYSVTYDSKAGFTTGTIKKPRLLKGIPAKAAADIIQAGNFFKTSFFGPGYTAGTDDFNRLYKESVLSKFNPEKTIYLTTGEPHSRAFYLRNFAFFYSGLLNPATSVSLEDYINRFRITIAGLEFMLELFKGSEFTTTVVPVFGNICLAADYNSEPSDSILGILSAIESLVSPVCEGFPAEYREVCVAGSAAGRSFLDRYSGDLRIKVLAKLLKLRPYYYGGITCLIPDAERCMSAATDVREEKARFIVSANYYSMLFKAVNLGIIEEKDIINYTGMNLAMYKKSILDLFGREGYIRDSMADDYYDSGDPAMNICLDFVHTEKGFWDFKNYRERKLFINTAEIILSDKRFGMLPEKGIKMSVRNPEVKFFYRFSAPDYQGAVVWPFYNVRLASGLVGLYKESGDEKLLYYSRLIIDYLKIKTLESGGFPEVLNENGNPYRTWVYRSAIANSWLPGFKALIIEYYKVGYNVPK